MGEHVHTQSFECSNHPMHTCVAVRPKAPLPTSFGYLLPLHVALAALCYVWVCAPSPLFPVSAHDDDAAGVPSAKCAVCVRADGERGSLPWEGKREPHTAPPPLDVGLRASAAMSSSCWGVLVARAWPLKRAKGGDVGRLVTRLVHCLERRQRHQRGRQLLRQQQPPPPPPGPAAAR